MEYKGFFCNKLFFDGLNCTWPYESLKRDIHSKNNFTTNNNWVLQLSVFLPFTCLEKQFHSCEIKTVWTFPRGPKEVKGLVQLVL